MRRTLRWLVLSSLWALGCGSTVSPFIPMDDAASDAGADSSPTEAGADSTPQVDSRGEDTFVPTPPPDAPVRPDVPSVPDARPDGGPLPPPDAVPPSDGGPVPCPGDPSGTGLPCDTPGSGCGSSGPCGAAVECVCGADLRWVCRGSPPDPGCPDGGEPPPPPPPPPIDGGPVRCPMDPSESGTPCPSLGVGCGSIAPDGSLFVCRCTERGWQCETVAPPPDAGPPIDVRPPPDAGPPPDLGPAPDAGGCSLVGSWNTMFDGSPPIQFDFRADGTWTAMVTAGVPPTDPVISGTWTNLGGRMTIMDRSCDGSGPGTYDLSFGPACGAVTFNLGYDPCSSRARSLNGARMTRR